MLNIYVACALLIQFWSRLLDTRMNKAFEKQTDKAKATGVKRNRKGKNDRGQYGTRILKILNIDVACALLIQF